MPTVNSREFDNEKRTVCVMSSHVRQAVRKFPTLNVERSASKYAALLELLKFEDYRKIPYEYSRVSYNDFVGHRSLGLVSDDGVLHHH